MVVVRGKQLEARGKSEVEVEVEAKGGEEKGKRG